MRVVWAILIAFLLCAIFVAGCFESSTHVYDNVLSSVLFDPETSQFSVVGSIHPDREGFSSITLNDGTVLIAGGWKESAPNNIRPAELFCP